MGGSDVARAGRLHVAGTGSRTQFGFIILGILLGLLSMEGLLRLYFAMLIEPHTKALAQSVHVPGLSRTVRDARLGMRLNPLFPGYDARGWRNGSALRHADIVALGDSQTYGENVSTPDAWPQRLGEMLHRSAYQMATPGYGPGQYLLLFDEAAALRPNVIIAAFYLGNDLTDAYQLAYHVGDSAGDAFPYKNTSHDSRLDALVSTDPKTRESIQRAEAIDPNFLRLNYLYCDGHQPIAPDPHLQQVHEILTAPPLAPLVGKPTTSDSPPWESSVLSRVARNAVSRVWRLRESSLLYRVTGNAVCRVRQRMAPSLPARDYGPPICVHYHDREMSTVFNPGYRLIPLDRTDPRVAEGERISWLAYESLAERSRRAGIRFYVAVIPTKETAFRARAEAAYDHEPYLRDMWDAEADVRSRALAFFDQHGVEVIDTTPALQAAIASGVQAYLETNEGHPIKAGYEAIATAIAERLHKDGVGDMAVTSTTR
jgi:lysophospholipase L1-like esterase